MSVPSDVLIEVWRDACRHITVGECTQAVASTLRHHLPLDGLVVREIDVDRGRLRTVAAVGNLSPPPALPTVSGLDVLTPLLSWEPSGLPAHWASGASDERRRLLLGTWHADRAVLAVPLTAAEHVSAFVLLTAIAGISFEPQHRDLTAALREPLAVALRNDHVLAQLNRLRGAAEADRTSLLARLGRRAITETIVGAEAGLSEVMTQVNQVAGADVPVLILGETGSGKEVVARAVHTRSSRAEGPFLRVNCGAIPPELVDSELFGHERGSFTGATSARQGWFERADGGTLFLDEIGELPLSAQVRLLRVTQDGTFERVGGRRAQTVDVRIVAATHADLAQMVRDRRFREDLWYRLNVFPIQLPPLRDRLEDMPALAAHFADRACRRFGLPLLAPTLEDIDLLVRYDWPGNIRELAAVIDRAAILGNGKRLEIARALGGVQTATPSRAMTPPAAMSASPMTTLENAIRDHIAAALTETQGRVDGPRGAATLLAVNPSTLRAKIRKLGLRADTFRGTVRSGHSAGGVSSNVRMRL